MNVITLVNNKKREASTYACIIYIREHTSLRRNEEQIKNVSGEEKLPPYKGNSEARLPYALLGISGKTLTFQA